MLSAADKRVRLGLPRTPIWGVTIVPITDRPLAEDERARFAAGHAVFAKTDAAVE